MHCRAILWRTSREALQQFWEEFSEVAPGLLRNCLSVQISSLNACWGNFLEVRFSQRRPDDNKNKIVLSRRGAWGQRGKSSKNAAFRGKRHGNRMLKAQIFLSRKLIVMNVWLSLRRLLFRTPETSQKLHQKSALRCIRRSSLQRFGKGVGGRPLPTSLETFGNLNLKFGSRKTV